LLLRLLSALHLPFFILYCGMGNANTADGRTEEEVTSEIETIAKQIETAGSEDSDTNLSSSSEESLEIEIEQHLPEHNYDWKEKILGTGELSVVHSASSVHTGKKVAIKRVAPKQLNHRRVQQIWKEASILNKISQISDVSTYFVNLVEGFIDHQGGICLVTDRIPGVELFEIIVQNPNGIPEAQVKIYIRQILAAVHELHTNDIAHLDLKLENIMYNPKTNKINIIDFGFAEETVTVDIETGERKPKLLNKFCGSLDYSAPEILQHKEFDGKRADVWSLGVIVFALLTGNFPFDAPRRQRHRIQENIVIGKYPMPDTISPFAASFLRRMLQKYPDNRSNVASLMKHPWLRRGNPQANR